MENLGIGRIEGFQPYDEYVNRRLGRAFGFIKTLNRQLLYLRRDLDALYQYYSTESLQSITNEIDREEDAIRDIQRVGEDALFLGLLPYYVGNLLSDIFGFISKEEKEMPVWWLLGIVVSYSLYFERSAREFHIKVKENISNKYGFIDIDQSFLFLRRIDSIKLYVVYSIIWLSIILILIYSVMSLAMNS